MIKLVKASFTYQKQYRLTIRWLRKHNSGTIIRYPIFNISELQKNERNSWCCPFVFWHIASQTQPSEVFSTTFRTLLKSDFGLGVLLCICCIFSDDLFLRLPLEKCFCTPLMLVSRHFFVKANFPTFLVVLILASPICDAPTLDLAWFNLRFLQLFYQINHYVSIALISVFKNL